MKKWFIKIKDRENRTIKRFTIEATTRAGAISNASRDYPRAYKITAKPVLPEYKKDAKVVWSIPEFPKQVKDAFIRKCRDKGLIAKEVLKEMLENYEDEL